MSREILSTARPSVLRLAGSCAWRPARWSPASRRTMRWAVIGFPGDASGANDVPVHGTDIWEGKVVLLSVVVALVATLAIRLTASDPARRGLALLLVALGIVCAVLPALAALRAEDRLGGAQGLDRVVRALAAELGQPVDVVRGLLDDQFERQLRVDVDAAPWVTLGRRTCAGRGRRARLLWTRRRPEAAHAAGIPADADAP